MLAIAIFVMSASILCTSPAARADDTGYVCSVSLGPPSWGFGTYGYVYAMLYESPKCSGEFIGHYFFCSDSNRFWVCHTEVSYSWYNIPPLLQMLQSAATNETRTTILTGACKDAGGSNCAIRVDLTMQP
jgi:hypothetical protein